MIQLLANASYDFMRWKKPFLIFSTLVNVLGLAIFIGQYASGRLNVGIDFKGGTEVQVKFAEPVRVAEVRSVLEGAGLAGASVTTIGEASENEIYVRLPLQEVETQVLLQRVQDALRGLKGQAPVPAGAIDLNVSDEKTIADFIAGSGLFSTEETRAAGAAIADYKKDRGGIIRNLDDLASLEGINPQIHAWLKERASLSAFSIRSENSVEGAISKELAQQALYAILGSMIIMLVYIALRFRFQYGLGAIAALVHDVVVTIGIFCLMGKEWNIPVIAAFLTLTGYSVNDTIVTFDRIRENLKRKSPGNFEKVVNASINQTLSRTIITSGLTWLVVVALLVLGGEVLNGFAFVLTVGILVGTYSSIFIAAPIIIYWEGFFAGRSGSLRKARARA